MQTTVKIFTSQDAELLEAQINQFASNQNLRAISANITDYVHDVSGRTLHTYTVIVIFEALPSL